MHDAILSARLSAADPDDVQRLWADLRLEDWSDSRLIGAVGDVLRRPKATAGGSFILHAPLELMARIALLPRVPPSARGAARKRLVWLAATYAAAGEALPDPPAASPASVDAAIADLIAAMAAGDLHGVDRLAFWLGGNADPLRIRHGLAGWVAPALAAAGHGGILLDLLPRVSPRGELPGTIIRGTLRVLACEPDDRLRWFSEAPPEGDADLLTALLAVPHLGVPSGGTGISAILHQVADDLAPRLLTSRTRCAGMTGVARALARIAAWSMLEEPHEHAPYGWSHCLTIPQGILGSAEAGPSAGMAPAAAATHVVGFRAALGTRELHAFDPPEPPEALGLAEALTVGPEAAAVCVWHAPAAALSAMAGTLATRAALHHDAHLVKYTLACFDAMAVDPGQRRLYLAAAAHLCAWWQRRPADGFLA